MIVDNKVTLCFPNYISSDPSVSLSGGSWETSLPLVNLKSGVFSKVAVTTDTTLSSTKFEVGFSANRQVRVVALANHNLTTNANIRIKLWADYSKTELLYESDWIPVWESTIPTLSLEWEMDNYWLGKPSEDDLQGLTKLYIKFLETNAYARWLSIELDDTTNPEGFIKIGRLFTGDAWQPTYNADYGISYSYEIATEFETAYDSNRTEYAEVKTPKRIVSFNLSELSEEESLQTIYRMIRQQGVDKEILFTDTNRQSQDGFVKSFIGRMESVNPLTNPYYNSYSTSFNLKEIL